MSTIRSLIDGQIATDTLLLADQGVADDGCRLLTSDDLDGRLLKNVDLRGNRITSAGLTQVVAFLRRCGQVTTLALNWNDLENDSSEGLRHLAEMMTDAACQIRHLDLRNSNLSLNIQDPLARLLRSPNLRYLDLSWNNFTDAIVPSMVTAINSRQTPIQIELKGAGLTPSGLSQISQAVKNLGVRFPSMIEVKLDSESIMQDIDGKKKLILDNLYHNERVRKLANDSNRVILNPETSELEILMGEMMKKKIMAKDKLLRQVDELLKNLHHVDNEAAELAELRDRASNENMALRRELENLKTTYSKTKQAFQIEQESLSTQASSLNSLINKRGIEGRSAVDKLLHAERMRARDFANQLEQGENVLIEKIKTLSIDRDRLNKDLAMIKEKMAAFMNRFNSGLREREIQLKQEEKARAEYTLLSIDSRMLSLTETNQMAQRRANDELRNLTESEESMLKRIEQLHAQLSCKRHLVHSLDDAIKTVQINNDRMLQEDANLDSKMARQKDQLYDIMDKIKAKKEAVEIQAIETSDAQEREIIEIGMARQSKEETVNSLEATLRKLRLEVDRLDVKREHIVERVNRRVTDVISEMARKYH